ncbi:MAG: hypothetical protein HOZ81_08600 [Streptomyces sp.]|nr:hypothetical protein [Streptomyces sp.]NUT26953.1 hypothetical protein [Streptomyces sp.]
MGIGFLWVPLSLWVLLMVPFCLKVADKSSWRVGWLMATATILFPLALVVAVLIP